jgi:Tfp pilus assembly protein PilF
MGRRLLPLLLAAFAACAHEPPPRPKPRPAPAPTAAERREAEQAYSQAVSAYVAGDFGRARGLMGEVLRLDPRHSGARTLREKLDAAEKASKQP